MNFKTKWTIVKWMYIAVFIWIIISYCMACKSTKVIHKTKQTSDSSVFGKTEQLKTTDSTAKITKDNDYNKVTVTLGEDAVLPTFLPQGFTGSDTVKLPKGTVIVLERGTQKEVTNVDKKVTEANKESKGVELKKSEMNYDKNVVRKTPYGGLILLGAGMLITVLIFKYRSQIGGYAKSKWGSVLSWAKAIITKI